MTLQEFERHRLGLEREKFHGELGNPLNFGMDRALFEKKRLQHLIDLGRGVPSKTVQAKVQRWKRQMHRVDASIKHLEKIKEEIEQARLKVTLPDSSLQPLRRLRARFE